MPKESDGSKVVTVSLEELEALIEKKAKEIVLARPDQFAGLAEHLKSLADATNSQAKEIARTVRKENASPPKISAFSHPEGDAAHPKPPLRYETYYLGQRVREDSLTPHELELFNRFDSSKEARNGMWTATVSTNGTKQRLDIVVPAFRNDQRMDLPSLTAILMELHDGPDAVDPLTSLRKVDDLLKRVKELETQLASKAA